MAIRTLGAHRVAMNVIGFVAGKAVRRRLAMLAAGLVAFSALGFAVFAEQGKVGQFMIEGVFVELHDIGIPAFMVGMTACTVIVSRIAGQAVKTGSGLHISGDILVTVQAQASLFRTLEFRVAGIAIFLVFGMAFDDFTGHHQRLDLRVGWFGYHPQ